jgi:GGDEF domain-containing protein
VDGTELPIRLSVGLVHVDPGEETDLPALVDRGDRAMYQQRHRSHSRIRGATDGR